AAAGRRGHRTNVGTPGEDGEPRRGDHEAEGRGGEQAAGGPDRGVAGRLARRGEDGHDRDERKRGEQRPPRAGAPTGADRPERERRERAERKQDRRDDRAL